MSDFLSLSLSLLKYVQRLSGVCRRDTVTGKQRMIFDRLTSMINDSDADCRLTVSECRLVAYLEIALREQFTLPSHLTELLIDRSITSS